MSNLTVFSFEGQDIRFSNDGRPVANDVAKVLGYKHPSNAVFRIVSDKNKGVWDLHTPGGIQSAIILQEAGIYQLIFKSKLPSAIKFQDWVFEEVLPSIRKTGQYAIQQNPAFDSDGIKNMIQEQLAPVLDYVKATRPIVETLENLPGANQVVKNSIARHLENLEPITVYDYCSSKGVDRDLWFTVSKRYANAYRFINQQNPTKRLLEGNAYPLLVITNIDDLIILEQVIDKL